MPPGRQKSSAVFHFTSNLFQLMSIYDTHCVSVFLNDGFLFTAKGGKGVNIQEKWSQKQSHQKKWTTFCSNYIH